MARKFGTGFLGLIFGLVSFFFFFFGGGGVVLEDLGILGVLIFTPIRPSPHPLPGSLVIKQQNLANSNSNAIQFKFPLVLALVFQSSIIG